MGNNFSGSRNKSLNTCRSQSITISKDIINGIVNHLVREEGERKLSFPLHIAFDKMTADGSLVDLELNELNEYSGLMSMLVVLSWTSWENECTLNFNLCKRKLMSVNCTYISNPRFLGLAQKQTLEFYRDNIRYPKFILCDRNFILCRKFDSKINTLLFNSEYNQLSDWPSISSRLLKYELERGNHDTIDISSGSRWQYVFQELGMVQKIVPDTYISIGQRIPPAVAPPAVQHPFIMMPAAAPLPVAHFLPAAPLQEEPSLVFQPLPDVIPLADRVDLGVSL